MQQAFRGMDCSLNSLQCVRPHDASWGALSSQSFCERMNSVANLVITKNRMKMGDELLHKLVVLHINGKFMEACHRNGKPPVILFPDLPNDNE